MTSFTLGHIVFAVAILQFTPSPIFAQGNTWEMINPASVVYHHDVLDIDKTLTIAKVVDATMDTHPDADLITAMEEEAAAIEARSNSWTAGASQIAVGYQSMYSFRLNYATANVMVPVWNFGQRDAQRELAKTVEAGAELQASAIKLRLAGLVRGALWDIALAKNRYEQANDNQETYKKLFVTIKRRVELGDLPRSDELLAQTEFFQKRSVFINAEAELMHARKRYTSITRITKIPSAHEEKLVDLKELEQNHPAITAIDNHIERKEAEIKTIKTIGSGQTNLIAGILSDEGIDQRSNHAEFFNVGVIVPFGGGAHTQPQIAALNIELTQLTSQREQLYRGLEQAHHEAIHNLEVNTVELNNATEHQKIAEELLSMKNLAFSVGEIDLLELLKIQSQAQQAILYAKERAVIMQRDIAAYNQAVGIMP
jgi:outer membrane protein TolC